MMDKMMLEQDEIKCTMHWSTEQDILQSIMPTPTGKEEEISVTFPTGDRYRCTGYTEQCGDPKPATRWDAFKSKIPHRLLRMFRLSLPVYVVSYSIKNTSEWTHETREDLE